jgi:MoaA/NifB/PqqE/SkfB family radical SAM enzyme
MRVDEYQKLFSSLGRAVAWVTLSGGDQFTRQDLPEIIFLVREKLAPRVINIPINGIQADRIESLLPEVARLSKGSSLVLNFSIDDLDERHDQLRGHQGNFKKVISLFHNAKQLQRMHPHLSIGIHTVISKLNVQRIPAIYEELIRLEPDAYLTEIAEERVELGTIGKDITPDLASYSQAVDLLKRRMLPRRSIHPVGRMVESIRFEYYDLVKRILRDHTQVIPCYSGWASAQIAPDGEVWGCCVRAESFGNLRDVGHDFRKIWFSSKAKEFRASVRANRCACPLANAAYTNMLFSPTELFRIAFLFLRHRAL